MFERNFSVILTGQLLALFFYATSFGIETLTAKNESFYQLQLLFQHQRDGQRHRDLLGQFR